MTAFVKLAPLRSVLSKATRSTTALVKFAPAATPMHEPGRRASAEGQPLLIPILSILRRGHSRDRARLRCSSRSGAVCTGCLFGHSLTNRAC